MKSRLNFLQYDSKVYVWDTRDQILNRLMDSSGKMKRVLDLVLCSEIRTRGAPLSKEDAWRLILKSEGKTTTVTCSTCNKELELYKDPVYSAFRDVDVYSYLCEECFREEYKGIAEPADEPYPKPPVDLVSSHPDVDLSLKIITALIEDPPWPLTRLWPPVRERPIRILDRRAYDLKHHLKNET